jgi:hypothetical protein
MKAKKKNTFEAIFHDFVEWFGGEVLPEAPEGHTADYLFRKQKIIAELKTMTVDQTVDADRKLTPYVEQWAKKHNRMPEGIQVGGKYVVEIKNMPPEIQAVWMKMLKTPAEDLIKQANRQIRDTKERLSMPKAKGMILIANEANTYHNNPDDYRRLMGEILRKRTSTGKLRFDHIHAGIYFSPVGGVKSREEGMFFWANLQMKRRRNANLTSIKTFQKALQQGWYKYIEDNLGIKVRQH